MHYSINPANYSVTSNTTETTIVPKQVPSLNITIPLLPNTTDKVSGWVSPGSGAEIEIDGPHGGIQAVLKTQSNGYFSDTVEIPENIPPGTQATVKLLSNNKVVIKQRLIVGNPYTS